MRIVLRCARAGGDSPVATKLKIKPRRRKRWNDYEYRRELIWSLLDQDQYFVLYWSPLKVPWPSPLHGVISSFCSPGRASTCRREHLESTLGSAWNHSLSLESLAEVPFSR